LPVLQTDIPLLRREVELAHTPLEVPTPAFPVPSTAVVACCVLVLVAMPPWRYVPVGFSPVLARPFLALVVVSYFLLPESCAAFPAVWHALTTQSLVSAWT